MTGADGAGKRLNEMQRAGAVTKPRPDRALCHRLGPSCRNRPQLMELAVRVSRTYCKRCMIL